MNNHYRKTQIYKYTLKGEFVCAYSTCVEAGKANYIYPRVIEKCCRGELRYAGEYQWRRVRLNHPTTKIKRLVINSKRSYSPVRVDQYDLDDNYLKTYRSVNEAGRENHISNKSIRDCINGKQKTAGSFRWKKA